MFEVGSELGNILEFKITHIFLYVLIFELLHGYFCSLHVNSGASVHENREKLYENLFLWSETNEYVNANTSSYASSILMLLCFKRCHKMK